MTAPKDDYEGVLKESTIKVQVEPNSTNISTFFYLKDDLSYQEGSYIQFDPPTGYDSLSYVRINQWNVISIPTITIDTNNITKNLFLQKYNDNLQPHGVITVGRLVVSVPEKSLEKLTNTRIQSNGTVTISNLMSDPSLDDGITSDSTLIIDVDQNLVESTKTANAVSNGNSSYSVTVSPSSGYDGIESAVFNISNYTYYAQLIASLTAGSITTNSYVNYYYRKITQPSNDNSMTSLQTLCYVKIKSNISYSGIQEVDVQGRIQNMTITDNGTYYPYDNSTVVKKIVVNVTTSYDRVYFANNTVNLSSFSSGTFTLYGNQTAIYFGTSNGY